LATGRRFNEQCSELSGPKFRTQAQISRWRNLSSPECLASLSAADEAAQLSEVLGSFLNDQEEVAMRPYRQLSLDERYQIQTRLRMKQSVSTIANAIGRDPSTVYREMKRNSDPVYSSELQRHTPPRTGTRYSASRAQGRTAKRRVAKGEAQRKIQGELQTVIENKLRLSWSPEQIAGRLQSERNISISHETIYQHILRDTKKFGFYRYCLRFAGYKHHRFKKSKMAERTRARKNWIEDRPAAANERAEIGHWERDLLLGKRSSACLLTVEDRKSRYVKMRYLKQRDADTVADATIDALAGLPAKTMTNDNGVEFHRDESMAAKSGLEIYFCNPYSPWERGSVENTNGLIRQYLPKGSDLDDLPPWVPTAVEDTLNFRPRKVLGYKTPHEVFYGKTLELMDNPAMHFGLEFSGAG
jgi:transposase, IS30 family